MRILRTNLKTKCATPAAQAGMTLIEVVIALLISSVAVSCMVSGYVFSISSAERAALSLAAGNRAMERLEKTRGARWDLLSYPQIDELKSANFTNEVVVLDVSGSGNAFTYATNITTIYQISSDPPLRGIRVECIYRFDRKQLITNIAETARGPD